MKRLRLLELVLEVSVWLTEWGVYLVVCGVSLAHPSVLEQIGLLFEQHPYAMAGVIASWVVLHLSLKGWHRHIAERNRQEAYQQWAKTHHWTYNPRENRQLYRHYAFLYGIPGYAVRFFSSQQRFPCMIDVLEGTWRGYPAQGFTYYSRKVSHRRSGKSTHTQVSHYYLAITLIQVPYHFPKVYLRPAHWSDKLMKLMNWHPENSHLSFEVKTPKNCYQIQTSNLQFAHQFFHSEMVAFLDEKMRLEVDRNVLVLYQEGRLQPQTIEANLECLHHLYQLIPPQWKR